MFDRDLILD